MIRCTMILLEILQVCIIHSIYRYDFGKFIISHILYGYHVTYFVCVCVSVLCLVGDFCFVMSILKQFSHSYNLTSSSHNLSVNDKCQNFAALHIIWKLKVDDCFCYHITVNKALSNGREVVCLYSHYKPTAKPFV